MGADKGWRVEASSNKTDHNKAEHGGMESSERKSVMTETPEKPEACDHCNWETAQLQPAGSTIGTDDPLWLCNVCRSTLAGNVAIYPRQYTSDVTVLASTLCWGINAILDAIKRPTGD